MNVGVLHLLGEPWQRSFLAGVVLAQIGEFSFVILAAGASVGIVDSDGYRLFVALIALNLTLSPLWLNAARRLHRLALSGAPTLSELLEELYGHEAAVVAEGSARLVAVVRSLERTVRSLVLAQIAQVRAWRSKYKRGPPPLSPPRMRAAAAADNPPVISLPTTPKSKLRRRTSATGLNKQTKKKPVAKKRKGRASARSGTKDPKSR